MLCHIGGKTVANQLKYLFIYKSKGAPGLSQGHLFSYLLALNQVNFYVLIV